MIEKTIEKFLEKAVLWCYENNAYTLASNLNDYFHKLKIEKYDRDILRGAESEILYEFAKELWIRKEFDTINYYKSFIEKESIKDEDSYIIPDFSDLSDIAMEYSQFSDNKAMYIWAKGYASLGFFDEAIQICSDLLEEITMEDDLVIEIRRSFDIWYDYTDECIEKRENNLKQLIKILPDVKECIKFTENNWSYVKNDLDFLIEFLKERQSTELWDIILSNFWFDKEKVIFIYGSVSPQITLNINSYNIVFDAYLSKNNQKEIKKIINIVKNKINDSYTLYKMNIKYLMAKEEWDKALTYVNDAMLAYNSEELLIFKGVILCCKSKFIDALQCFENCSEDKVFGNKFNCYYYLHKYKKAIQIFYSFYENNESSAIIYLSNWITNNQYDEKFLIKLLNNLKVKDQKNKYCIIEDYLKNYILQITENITKDRGKIRYHLLRIYLCINIIKIKLAIQTQEVYHYSKEESLKYLPRYKNIGGSKLRLSNVAYLNDPVEGNTFFEILENECQIGNIKKILGIDGKTTKYENLYLASFSRKEDFLPMWVQYSADGTGCCYAIDTRKFGIHENNAEYHILENVMGYKIEDILQRRYSLYEVCYYGGKESNSEIIALCKVLGEHLKIMQDVILENKKIRNFVNELLDSIRYLFKDKAYEAEKEVRIIQVDYYCCAPLSLTCNYLP